MIRDRVLESSVDWPDLERGILYVRDKELLKMVEEFDFIDTIFHTWIHKRPSAREKRMLNAVLVSFSGGWSFLPPVVLGARIAATTRAPVAQCLAAGFSAGGPLHTSAIEGAMELYLDEQDVEERAREMLRARRPLPGFGHPAVPKDPRPEVLHALSRKLGVRGVAVRKFEKLRKMMLDEKGVHPNIDGINGAIMVDLGFRDKAYGPAAFLIGRSLGLTAHIVEEYGREPYYIMSIVNSNFGKVRYAYRGRGGARWKSRTSSR